MKAFSIIGASYYCESFEPRSGIVEQSPEEFRRERLNRSRSITEGTKLFDEYRACALRDAERSLFLSASHYRRSLDLMIPSSSHWAQVTLYYGAWFAARALLGMFGCIVLRNHVIHVNRSTPGNQELRVERIGAGEGRYYVTLRGSHRQFWEIFYRTVPSVRRFVDDKHAMALSPVSSNLAWLIEQRNRVNYSTAESVRVAQSFSMTFEEDKFPDCLPGVLHTQYRVNEGILAASCSFATRFGLATDALDVLGSSVPFSRRVRDLVYDPVLPDLAGRAKQNEVFGS